MDAKSRDKLIERARSLEKAGQREAAVKAFRDAGSLEEAARLLGSLRKPREAGQLLLESLGVAPGQVAQLEPAGKKRALMAAIFLGKAGENEVAVQLFLALGEQQRAVELLERAGDRIGAAKVATARPGEFEPGPLIAPPRVTAVGGQPVSILTAQKLEEQGKLEPAMQAYVQLKRFADAARVAQALGRAGDAAQLYADAGMPMEAAHAYLEAGDSGKALDNLCRVPRDHQRYRTAAAHAVRLATNLGVLDFNLEHFLGPFVASGPQGAEEIQVFELLAQLYGAHGFPENAREALEKILAREPANARARTRLQELEQQLRPSPMLARQVLADADLHRKGKPALDLGDLPDLDDPILVATDPGTTVVRAHPSPPQGGESAVRASDRIAGNPPAIPGGPPGGKPPEPREAAIVEQPAAARDDFAPGSTIAGRYRLEAKIGEGGMAAVFRAFDLELEERVALKVFNAAQTSDVLLSRFRQELKLSRQLLHPNLVRLYDIGVHERHRYISMELLVGRTLKDRMAQPIEFRTALGYLVQACHGLQAAHEAGVIHRDVKPDNFFVTDDGVLKVMDFGIAKQYAAPGVTVAGSIAGTPLYMSPEQIGSFSEVTHLTDLYALGVCAYEIFTGTTPFFHEELVPLLMMHVNEKPPPPRTRNPDVPPELEKVILKLLAKDPRQRYQSCRELAQELGALRDASAA